jgi:predicted small metal-binding protein
MKELRCKDAGQMQCNFVARGKSVEEVMKLAAEHGKKAHQMNDIPQEMQAKLKSLVREVSDR